MQSTVCRQYDGEFRMFQFIAFFQIVNKQRRVSVSFTSFGRIKVGAIRMHHLAYPTRRSITNGQGYEDLDFKKTSSTLNFKRIRPGI